VWGGYSCLPPFDVDFELRFRELFYRSMHQKLKVNGGGQECPPHTGMESTMKKQTVFLVALLATLSQPFQSQALSTPRDYSFTISTTQPWTDTGIDLQAGDTIEVTAAPAHAAAGSSGNVCDPRGASGSDQSNSSLPVAAAPAGSLIARLQEQGTALAVGGNGRLKADAPGHLFFGVNSAANAQSAFDCTGNFAVKVHITGAVPAAASGNALAASPVVSTPATSASTASAPTTASTAASPATTAATSPTASKTEPAQDIKSKLATAAQVFLAGQFGTGAAPASSSAVSNEAVPAGVAAPAPVTPALNLSTATLDAGLRKDVDGLPRRVNDQFNNQGDMVNFVLVGSQEQVQSALEAANWHVADVDNREAVLKAVLETYQKKDYLAMPMSQLYLFGRKQDFGYELAQAYSVVASRHHFRIWKAPSTWNGTTMWAGAGTHDIGFEKDQRNGSVTHKIDPAVDGERDNIGSTLQQARKVKSMSYYLPPDPVQGAKNATGGGYHSDGRILVIVLQ
jgi:hypothetical protein